MDDNQFDGLIRAFGQGTSRRGALGLLAAAAGLGLREVGAKAKHHKGKGQGKGKGAQSAAGGGNSTCAHFCATVFGADTPAAGQCTSDAAHGKGLCYECGPGCGSCSGKTRCGQQCVNTNIDTGNCSRCGKGCPGNECNAATCVGGSCGLTPTPGVPCAGGTGTCDASGQCHPNTPNVCSGKTSPNPCFPRNADTCGTSGTGRACTCGTDLDGNLACYDLAYCLNPRSETLCESNADCEAKGFGLGSVCFSAENCCLPDDTGKARGCTAPCAFPAA
jgi:hypothetical protein